MPADDGMPFGRLRALCPYGTIREQPAHAVIGALLAKNAKKITKSRQNGASVSLHKDIDLLAARGLYNAACSPLCRLPDDVLVRILGYIDMEDMMCIRRTSRIFLRLFSRDAFSHLHDNNSINNTGLFVLPTPWKSPVLPINDQRLWANMNRRVIRSQYKCTGCSKIPTSTYSGTYMHCTACNVDHPTSFFSAAQMESDKETIERRVCVAHEGHVRLCKHKTVELSTVLASLPGGRFNNNFINNHRSGQTSSTSGGDRLASFSLNADLRIVCDHPSHLPGHHQASPTVGILAPESSSSSSSQSSQPPGELPPPPPYQRFTAEDGSEAPSFVIHDMMVSGVKHKVATWSYTAHMDLTGLGDPNNNCAITAQVFRDRINELRKGHSPARYIAPKDYPGILQELRCVDPDRCGCLLYLGFQRKEGQRPCQDHEVMRTLVSRVTDIDNIRVRLVSCDHCVDGNITRCLKVVYTRTICLQGFYIDPAPNWPPAIHRGKRRVPSAHFLRLRDAFRNKSVPYGWYQALDPCSYGLTDDLGRQHVTWCRGKRCRLNPSFLREKYVAWGEEINAECKFGCENSHHVGLHQTGEEFRDGYIVEIPFKEQWGRWMNYKSQWTDTESMKERGIWFK